MCKTIITILSILGLLFSKQLAAQGEIEFTASPKKTKKILLVPFDPNIYFNDATEIIAKKDKLTHDEVLLYFREEFNKQLYNALMDSCFVTSLLQTANTRDAEEDINNVYSIISYELGLAMPNRPENNEEKQQNFFTKRKERKEEERKKEEIRQSKTRVENGEIVGKRMSVEDKYLHIVLHQPEVLAEISRRRNVDYFLFINQFEIKGDYRDPYLSGNSKSQRIMKVHFSLFDSNGKLIHGGFGKNEIPFYLDDKREIVSLYFPEVIRQIIRNIDF